MTQDAEIQLQVWKDLAISKQILMGAATDALGLDAECSTEELKEALDKAIKRARDADLNIQQTRSEAEAQVAEFKQQAEAAEKARAEAENQVRDAVDARDQAQRKLATGKAENAEALKRARAEVGELQNKLKSISKALADTPENVVRKLKTLKKQKLEEARLRTQAEKSLQASRKEKSQLEADLAAAKSTLEASAKLVEQVRTLHALCQRAEKTVAKLSDKKKDQLQVPPLDEAALESIEQALERK